MAVSHVVVGGGVVGVAVAARLALQVFHSCPTVIIIYEGFVAVIHLVSMCEV